MLAVPNRPGGLTTRTTSESAQAAPRTIPGCRLVWKGDLSPTAWLAVIAWSR
jgi:hypothetical protein